MARKKTRSYRKGSVYAYKTKLGTRYRWQANFRLDPLDDESPIERLSKGGYLTMGQASEAMQTAMNEAKVGYSPRESKDTFAEYSKVWFGKQKLANSTLQGYEKIIRVHLVPAFGKMRLTQILPSHISTLYKNLEKHGNRGRLTSGTPLSANTINKIHIILGSILESALDDGLVKRNQARVRSVHAPTSRSIRMQKKELKTWSGKDLKDFLNWSKNVDQDDFYVLWHLYFFSGMRRGEGVALQWDDINFETRVISVRRASDSGLRKAIKPTKTYRERPVLMDAETLDLLKAHKAERASLGLQFVRGSSFVFGTLDGTVRNPGDIGEKWSKTLKRAKAAHPGLAHLTIKGIRHTHATHLLEAGVEGKVVQERLGHSNISTTMDVYAHVTPTMQVGAVDSLMTFLKSA